MNVYVGNASLVECICECCKANCVTNVTNETVCSDSLCLMWPHGLSVWRNDGRLVSLHVRTAVRAIVGPVIVLSSSRVVAQALRSNRVVVVRISGRVVVSIASLWSWSSASRKRIVTYVA